MTEHKHVVIDGVRYAPVTEFSPDAARITRVLVEQYMKEGESDERIAQLARELTVVVDALEEGGSETVEEFVARLFAGGSA